MLENILKIPKQLKHQYMELLKHYLNIKFYKITLHYIIHLLQILINDLQHQNIELNVVLKMYVTTF